MAKTAAKSSTKKSNVVPIAKKKTPTAKASTKDSKPAKRKGPENPKYVGKTTGMRVQAFQDKLMKDNYKAKLTDAQLAKAMRAEFPHAAAFTEAHVAGIRSQYNNGKRASQDGAKPAKPLPRFDEEGNAIAPRTRGERKAKKAAPTKAKKAKAAPASEADDEELDEEEIDEEESEEEDVEDEDVEEEDDEDLDEE